MSVAAVPVQESSAPMKPDSTPTGAAQRLDPGAAPDGAAPQRATAGTDADADALIEVVEENLRVERRRREGRVRVRKVVHEDSVEVDEVLHDERVHVERVAVGRALDGPVGTRQEGDVLIVPVVEERLVVEKRLVLVEELWITRETQQHRHTQPVTLRREEVMVERQDPATNEWSPVESSPGATPPARAGIGPDIADARTEAAVQQDSATEPCPQGTARDTSS
jgi:uncharacterized protein (TIGR02271 family)